MNFPTDLLYTTDHEWIRIEENTAYIGITDYAQSELGEIVFVDVDSLDNTVQKGEVFGTIEAVKAVSDLYMPVSGTVLEVNPDLDDHPELINEDPYGDGWIIKIEITGKGEEQVLLSQNEYTTLINE
ncbi:MAG: glycine cleavage system protein GcvH [Candidatus Azobacteroides sp.]|nr:glycine cleavage system protein GcvH [Candidatus Azobacteroides sp.]